LGLWAGEPLLAQTPPSAQGTPAPQPALWYINKPISDIRFDGLSTVQRSDVEGVTRPYLGKKYSDQLYKDLLSDIINLDLFQGYPVVTVIKGNDAGDVAVLLIKVVEKPIVDAIEFAGTDRVHSGDLEGVLTSKKGDIVNRAKVDNDVSAIKTYYQEHGFLTATVDSTVEDIDEHRTKIIFKIVEGTQTAVKSIEFRGNSVYTTDQLRNLMDTKTQFWIFQEGLFKEAALTKDLKTIEAFYGKNGYIDARVIDVERNVVRDQATGKDMLNLVITVREGQAMVFGGYQFQGNRVFSTDILQNEIHSRTGTIINKETLEADYQRVIDLYLENGYIFNDISRQETRDGKTATYKVTIVERARAHIENITVKGNTKTKDKVILREVPLESGDVFSKAKFIEGLQNLNNLQYFTSVTPETPRGSADGLMDLVLNVEEGKTADISFGLSFSGTANFPISAQVKWAERNFMGNGQQLGVDSTFSPTQQSVNLNFTENWFLDQRITLGGQIGVAHLSNTLVDQDILGPTYSNKEIPDPYVSGQYVFTENQTFYNGRYYNAGDLFPLLNPSDSMINQYHLLNQYQYDVNNGTVKKNAQMTYDAWQFTVGINTGYSWYTPFGRFGLGTGEKNTLQLVTYDSKVYRPANEAVRENLNVWLLDNQWWTKFTWDTRDLVYNPTRGYFASETVTLGGGFLGGNTHFTRTDTKTEAYFKLISWPVTDGYLFQLVFKARTAFSFLSSSIGGPNALIVQPIDELYIDGMLYGRGWGYQTDGKSSWTSGVELRTPVPYAEKFLWIDTWIDHNILIDIDTSPAKSNPFARPLTDQKFAWGTGMRIVSPQFPIALYLAKPFVFDNNNHIVWTTGDGIFGKSLDLKLVVSFGTEY
jgi:outer membrane protein insertion porin family